MPLFPAERAAVLAGAAAPVLLAARVLPGIAVTAAFAVGAWLVRGVTVSGAIAGALVTFAIFLGAGWAGFAGIVSVFVLTAAATRAGYARKLAVGTAERRGGRRRASQVFANLGVAAAMAIVALVWRPAFLVVMLAALAEAAADTVSSELGQAFGGTPRLLTTLQPAPVGTDGAISGVGTFAGCAAALAIAAVGFGTRVVPLSGFGIAAGAGVAGMIFDSALGATLERRRFIGNDGVNLLSTAFAAAVASALLAV